jgi:arylsulfatase A-like enzyme
MTGRNPMHTGLDPLNFTSTIEKRGGDSSLSADYIFIPRLLQSAGYESHMLGKVRPHATPHSV